MRKGKRIIGSIFLIFLTSALLRAESEELIDESFGNFQNLVVAMPRLADEALFLDPYILPYLQDLEGQTVLDAGCGAAHWAVLAAQKGAMVDGIDEDRVEIDHGTLTAQAAGMGDLVTLIIGDVAELPYPRETFDRAFSINVGCYLTSTIRRENKITERKLFGLGPHFKQMARVLKPEGLAIVTAPASLGIVFTDGTSQEKVMANIEDVLQALESSPEESEIISCLDQLFEVQRATFALSGEKLVLVTQEEQLEQGQVIWRKLPDRSVKNHYHPETEYFRAFKAAKMKVTEIHRPKFVSEEMRKHYNETVQNRSKLGEEYVSDNPFVIYCLKKNE